MKSKENWSIKALSAKPYLCGPINGCTDDEANTWRELVLETCLNAINPMIRDYRGRESEDYREIVELDKRDVRSCDVVLVNYVKPSVGSSMEIYYAWSIGKPVITWCRSDISISPWLRYHSTTFVHNIDEAIEAIGRCM